MAAPKMKVTLNSVPSEDRAYVYQQLRDFIPFLLPDSEVKISVSEEDSEEESVTVVLILTGDGSFVESEAKGNDFYTALSKAKKTLLDHLQSIQQHLLSEESDETNGSAEFH